MFLDSSYPPRVLSLLNICIHFESKRIEVLNTMLQNIFFVLPSSVPHVATVYNHLSLNFSVFRVHILVHINQLGNLGIFPSLASGYSSSAKKGMCKMVFTFPPSPQRHADLFLSCPNPQIDQKFSSCFSSHTTAQSLSWGLWTALHAQGMQAKTTTLKDSSISSHWTLKIENNWVLKDSKLDLPFPT